MVRNKITMNKIQINTPFLNYNGSKDTIQGYTSVDYLEFSGKSKPNAINSKLYLEVDKQNENSFVYVNGFNNANQVYIDSLNNKIGFAKYINSGTLVRIGGIEQNNQSQISLSINDSNSFLSLTQLVLHLLVLH